MFNNIAHINNSTEQTISEHNKGVASLCQINGRAFSWLLSNEKYLYDIGLNHDIGKSSFEFGQRINGFSIDLVDHKTAGAKEMLNRGLIAGAFCIEGHHNGLPDGNSESDSSLYNKVRSIIPLYDSSLVNISTKDDISYRTYWEFMFRTRMMYSALVDADAEDTGRFMGSIPYDISFDSLEILAKRVRRQEELYLRNCAKDSISRLRNEFLQVCITEGEIKKTGIFNLTGPCGIGKTFSTLAFAMHKALAVKHERIIYVLPFTTILTQNAADVGEIVGIDNIVMHSSVNEYNESDKRIFAAENWDAPIIFTTNVQFFESLFTCKPSKARKLHNIANSVIIIDESQKIPLEYTEPIVSMLEMLVSDCHCTIVLSSATQPAVNEYVKNNSISEIYTNYHSLTEATKRCHIVGINQYTLDELSLAICNTKQSICVLNSRKKANLLYDSIVNQLGKEGIFSLQRNKTQKLISCQIEEIKNRLSKGLRCIVISTSLIEAGVNVDFPIGYRELAGIDSIAQTAGRINREGKRNIEESLLTVFTLEGEQYTYPEQNCTKAVHELYGCFDGSQAIKCYFERLHKSLNTDQYGIIKGCNQGLEGIQIPFKAISERIRLIRSPLIDVIIPENEESRQYVEAYRNALKYGGSIKKLKRKLQTYSVSISRSDISALLETGAVYVVEDGSIVLQDLSKYTVEKGLVINDNILSDYVVDGGFIL